MLEKTDIPNFYVVHYSFCRIFTDSNDYKMRKYIIIILFLLLPFLHIHAQQSTVELLIKEGIELHDSAQYTQAIEKFESALRINPKSNLALYELSLTYLKLKEYDKTLEYSTKVINSNDRSLLVGAYAVKSEALAETGKIDTAIEILNEGLEKNGESFMMHFNLALNYYKKNDLDKTVEHVSRAIELDKTFGGAFLLHAYAQRDKGMWIRSIYSFQMFLLLEPDSRRAHEAFAEMLQVMYINKSTDEPVERSFFQMQMMKNGQYQIERPSDVATGLNGAVVFDSIQTVLEKLPESKSESDTFNAFMEVNRTILETVNKDSEVQFNDSFWSFYHPFFTSILKSNYYETFCRYISVSYFSESLQWWEENQIEAKNFINWFEMGEDVADK